MLQNATLPAILDSGLQLRRLFVSPGHNYFGHHSGVPGGHPLLEVAELHCLAGRGIDGDRFLDFKKDYKGQITFFAEEAYDALCHQFSVWDKSPGVFRRNAITRGMDLNRLIGLEFEIQGVRFLGAEHCKPCHWMDRAFHPGSEEALQTRGGLRARILTSGTLRAGDL